MDRKKDLIKTAGGKFVAPQKLEKLFTADPLIGQAFVYGDKQPYCVALIVPDAPALRRYAEERGIPGASPADWVQAKDVQGFYWARIQELQRDLAGFEQVKKIALLDQEFSLSAGELTPTLKVKRAAVAQRYESTLRGLYQP
jgi:long-chain acyl-CoA synthetase